MTPDFRYAPPSEPLDFVHLDQDIVVVNKPAGLLSVPGRKPEHQESLQTRLIEAFPELLLVHRLDMDTSGVMVFARNSSAQKCLNRQFENRLVEKVYIAQVEGSVEIDSGEVDLPLIVDWPNRPRQKVDYEIGKPSQTTWHVLDRSNGNTTVQLMPKTGRSHQLRVHMAAMGHPILGDRFYGAKSKIAASERLLLHALSLSFSHPSATEKVTFKACCEFFPTD